MKNREKFKEVFGFDLDWEGERPFHFGISVCPEDCPKDENGMINCSTCKWKDWQDKEYEEHNSKTNKGSFVDKMNENVKNVNDCLLLLSATLGKLIWTLHDAGTLDEEKVNELQDFVNKYSNEAMYGHLKVRGNQDV